MTALSKIINTKNISVQSDTVNCGCEMWQWGYIYFDIEIADP